MENRKNWLIARSFVFDSRFTQRDGAVIIIIENAFAAKLVTT